ncbi:hypothetical protein VIGAN_08111400 [Vigna angularis var. angularis]|uniref:RNA-binding S4 domain-containing protein n=1 Tax=Vigna angularis var. angularis TaxID=157739 RepID=A0A0S3SNV2_PHAAN|nr:hypothetical protein VIGAN_08111400 [Vigna angularis var. angularis]
MGAATGIGALSLIHCFSKSHTLSFASFRTLPRLTCSFSSSINFNISFAPPKSKPKPKPNPDPDPQPDVFSEPDGPLLIPWIVRGEDGNLKLQSEPPPSLLKAIATAQTGTRKDSNQTKTTAATSKPQKIRATAPPQYSKAARRFYNQNIKESSGARLSKVLAASGVASRRSCEELIFEGKVTVNGSACTTPQTRVDPAKDVIYVNGNRLPKRQPQKVYLALNKPKGIKSIRGYPHHGYLL